MIVAYSYIGPLPDYTLDTIYQTRLFFKGPIYFIISDLTSQYVSILQNKYNVTIIPYDTVIDNHFNECIQEHFSKFTILENVKGREKLFIYAFERFFILRRLMEQQRLTNVFFMELDNLIYDDPLKWERSFCTTPIAFMFDNYDRCASGICFIQDSSILSEFCECCLQYIIETDVTRHFMTEMQALDQFWKANPQKVQILPTHWKSENIPPMTYQHYERYNNSIFDSAGLGIYFGGIDTLHTGGLILTGLRSPWSAIDYTKYKYEWMPDEDGRLIPYLINDNKWIRINNLHIHSKQLKPHLSKDDW